MKFYKLCRCDNKKESRGYKRMLIFICILMCSGLFGCNGQDTYFAEDTVIPVEEQENVPLETGQSSDVTSQKQTTIYVDVDGAINNPGVYALSSESRVIDAIEAAGGTLDTACLQGINRAALLTDGQKLYIPTNEEWENGDVQGTDVGASDGKIDVNHADESTLCQISGIGQTRAQAIITYRTEHGLFSSIEDIQQVSGIGPSTYEKIKEQIVALQ